jgi:hypothetical protein
MKTIGDLAVLRTGCRLATMVSPLTVTNKHRKKHKTQ